MKRILNLFNYLMGYDSFAYFVSFVIVIAILSVPVKLAIKIAEWKCASYSEITKRKTEFYNLDCYVKHQDTWYTLEEYSNILTAKMLSE